LFNLAGPRPSDEKEIDHRLFRSERITDNFLLFFEIAPDISLLFAQNAFGQSFALQFALEYQEVDSVDCNWIDYG
jgi:hypothetical protein